jgi:hypothetical protein
MNHTFTFHTDPGHGWLECPVGLLIDLGIKDKVSRYSYRKLNVAFLEEDCDAALLVNALEAKGDTITFIEKNEPNQRSFVTRLDRFF